MRQVILNVACLLVVITVGLVLAQHQANTNVFQHGVSSHEATDSTIVIWTRLNITNLQQSIGNKNNFTLSLRVTTTNITDQAGAQSADFEQEITIGTSFSELEAAYASSDFAIQVLVRHLTQSFTNYWYQFVVHSANGDVIVAASPVGKFRTAPHQNSSISSSNASIKFVFTGDSDGAKRRGSNEAGSYYEHAFDVMSAAAREEPDFFLFIGDTIYADSEPDSEENGHHSASTLAEFWELYKINRNSTSHQRLLHATSTYAIWDDHEIRDNWNEYPPNNSTIVTNGVQAFHNYYPTLVSLNESSATSVNNSSNGGEDSTAAFSPNNIAPKSLKSSSCVQEPLYRKFNWGADLEVFILDERSCRTHEVEVSRACSIGRRINNNNDENNSHGGTNQFSSSTLMYLYPLVPRRYQDQLTPNIIELITSLGYELNDNNVFEGDNRVPASDECLAALKSTSRSMLGELQLRQFLSDLKSSNATYKIVVNEVPMQHLLLYPYDRWEGFPYERSQILGFIRNESISNVFFATADLHMVSVNNVYEEVFSSGTNGEVLSSPASVATEAVVGPIAMLTPVSSIRFYAAGFLNLFLRRTAYDIENRIRQVLPSSSAFCMNLDTFSYAAVEVASSSMKIAVKDYNGDAVRDDQDENKTCNLIIAAAAPRR